MMILGLNAYHADASAALIINGELVAALEEERLRRVKHWAGLPAESIRLCLKQAKLDPRDIDHIAINRNPNANLIRKMIFALTKQPSLATIRDRLRNAGKVRDIRRAIEQDLNLQAGTILAKVHHVEHHRAHLASSFLVSPFRIAAIASIDGFGDFLSTMLAVGNETTMKVLGRVTFPHSLGLFYLAFTQYLGFPNYGDEYKVMGLAAYGQPEYLDLMQRIVRPKSNGLFELNPDFFLHHSEGVTMTWENGAPVIGRVFSDQLVRLLGAPREKDEPITTHHQNLAASVQAMYEKACFHVLNRLYDLTHQKSLCLAGGCVLNSVANGKILDATPFEHIYIPPAPGDAGGAIGAAYTVWHQHLGHGRSFVMDRADWGTAFAPEELDSAIELRAEELRQAGCTITRHNSQIELCQHIAQQIAGGKVVGWFQGRMEWGARALGCRSILVDPRRGDMKDILNARIKRREAFRPFAPSILKEAVATYFERSEPSPFMTMTYTVRAERRQDIPAPTHIDGTGRLQTVGKEEHPLYWQLIKEFERLTGIPVLLNTSFNENEPIVCTPEHAIDCFLRTKMDLLAMGPFVISR